MVIPYANYWLEAVNKTPDKWSPSQKERAKLLFERYPKQEQAYYLAHSINSVYKTKDKAVAYLRLAKWYDKATEKSDLPTFRTVANTIMDNYRTILNYIDNKSTNASAESVTVSAITP